MPRIARVTFEDGFYHVFNRGVNRERIFNDTTDYVNFLQRLQDLNKKLKYDHSVYAYCLLPNHFHLLVRTRKVPLAKVMTSLLTSYGMKFNRRMGRVGPIFQNRFKSKLCDTDSYFLGGSRYIVLNAYHAGLEKDLGEYPWSSYGELFGGSPFQIIDRKDISRLLDLTSEGKRKYDQFLRDGMKLGDLSEDFGFDHEVEGSALFTTMAIKKYLRRKQKRK